MIIQPTLYDHIDINNFDTVIRDFQPDIVHFTGHGTKSGLVFQYGDPITAKQLKDLFRVKIQSNYFF